MNACLRQPTVDEIFGRPLAPAPWPSSRPVLNLATELLPIIEDAIASDAIELLALSLVERDDELGAVRLVVSEALTLAHQQHAEVLRLQRRLANLLDARRQERIATA